MKSVALLSPPLPFSSSLAGSLDHLSPPKFHPLNARFRVLCSSNPSESVRFFNLCLSSIPAIPLPNFSYAFCVLSSSSPFIVQMKPKDINSSPEYRPGILDDAFLNLFRNRMVQVSPISLLNY